MGLSINNEKRAARLRDVRTIVAAGLCLAGLAGCETTGSDPLAAPTPLALSSPAASAPDPSAFTPAEAANAATADDQDDLSIGKRQFRGGDYGLAEQHFRRAVEARPGDVEAWVGLAAAYDELKRFDLADRAYAQLVRIAGPRAEILNNRGYSYMLRGDLRRARRDLAAARTKDPSNPQIEANLQLLASGGVMSK
jgi:Flp pilus assembly protein TadD